MIAKRLKKREAIAVSFALLFCTTFGLVAGYRPFGIGMDFLNYDFFYSQIGVNDNVSYYRYESGFVWLAFIAKNWLHLDYKTFAAALMTTSLLIKTQSLSKLEHPFLAIMFYMACWFTLHENTQIRIAFALALLFLAANYMFQQRWLLFVGLAALASTFHTTALFGAVILAVAYWLSSYRLIFGVVIFSTSAAVFYATLDWFLPYFILLNGLLGSGDIVYAKPNIFSIVNLATVLFLVSSATSGSLISRRSRTFFLVCCAGFAIFLGFLSVPVLAHRLKEVLLVFMTFIAFEYRFTVRTLPQVVLAITLAVVSVYRSIAGGLFSD